MMNQANRMISLLLVLQVFSTGFLWTLDALNQVSEGIFALFVAVDLLAFAMVSYIYRAEKLRASPSRSWVLVGCILLIVIVFASLAIH